MWDSVRRRVADFGAGRSAELDRGSAAAWAWPVRLAGRTPSGVDVVLRPLTVDDGPAFQSVRRGKTRLSFPANACASAACEGAAALFGTVRFFEMRSLLFTTRTHPS